MTPFTYGKLCVVFIGFTAAAILSFTRETSAANRNLLTPCVHMHEGDTCAPGMTCQRQGDGKALICRKRPETCLHCELAVSSLLCLRRARILL